MGAHRLEQFGELKQAGEPTNSGPQESPLTLDLTENLLATLTPHSVLNIII